MSLVRAHLPQKLQNTKALKALCIKFMKHYIVVRQELWKSTTGAVSESIKGWLYTLSAGNVGSNQTHNDIVDNCSSLKSSIEKASKYSDYIALIEDLLKKISIAKSAEVHKMVSPSALRGELYYAIITLLHEILKIEFKDEYEANLVRLRNNYHEAYNDYVQLFKSGDPCDNIIETLKAQAYELVKIGDRESLFHAFQFNFNPNPAIYVRDPKAKGLAYVTAKKVDKITAIINNQMREEQGGEIDLVNDVRPNANLPLFLQPDFAMYYCYKRLRQSLNFATHNALKYYDEEAGKSFRAIIVDNMEQFVAENRPDETDTKSKKTKSNEKTPATKEKVRFMPDDKAGKAESDKGKEEAGDDNKAEEPQAAPASANSNHPPEQQGASPEPEPLPETPPMTREAADEPASPFSPSSSVDSTPERSASADSAASELTPDVAEVDLSAESIPVANNNAETPPTTPLKAEAPPSPPAAASPSLSTSGLFKQEGNMASNGNNDQLSKSARKKLARAAAQQTAAGSAPRPGVRK